MGRRKGVPLTDEHKAAIAAALQTSDKAIAYHRERQTGAKRKPFSAEWRAKMSVSRRFPNLARDSDAYATEVALSIRRIAATDRIKQGEF